MQQMTKQATRRVLHILGAGLLLVSLAACAGNAQEEYYDNDVGSPSQGAPLDGGEKEIEDFENNE